MNDWQRALLQEIRLEMRQNDRFSARVRYIEFISRSNGYGRPKRRWPRSVIFLVIDEIAFQVKSGEVKPRRGFRIDSLASEILTDFPWEERTIDALLAKARIRARTK